MSWWRRLAHWLRHPWRDQELEWFLARCRFYATEAAEWDRWQWLEHLDVALARALTFSEQLDLEMYRMKWDIKRDFRRQLWGEGPARPLTGLAAITYAMETEYKPYLWRSMQEPPLLARRLRSPEQ